MTGAVVLVVVLVLATAFGLYRRATDGRLKAVAQPPTPATGQDASTPVAAHEPTGPGGGGALTDDELTGLGASLGDQATLVQFSSAFCAPCRATRVILDDVAAAVPGVVHVEVDTESHLDLADRFDIRRTPTTLLLDRTGRVVHRAVGAPRKTDVLGALGPLLT